MKLRKIESFIALLTISLGIFISVPTRACACGMLVAERGKNIKMVGERGVVVYNSQTKEEQLVIDFMLDGSSNSTALIVPTPVKAEISQVQKELIDDLKSLFNPEATKGIVPLDSINATGKSENVEVLERKIVGRFDVAALKTNSYQDLFAWTEENDFRLQDEAESPVRTFIDEGYVLNVIKLKKDSEESDINPLKFNFKSEGLFYPLMVVKDELDSQKDKSLELFILSDVKIDISAAKTNNEAYSRKEIKDVISETDDIDFENLILNQTKYFVTVIDTNNYQSGNLISDLGNPEMKDYASLGLKYKDYTSIYYLTLIILGLLLSASYAYYALIQKRKLIIKS